MRIIILNLIIFSLLILFSEIVIRALKISQLQGVDRNLLNLEDKTVLNQPNSEAVIFGKKAYTDKYGFRIPSKDFNYKYRTSILVLGDSVSFGVGVDERKTFIGILRNTINLNIYNASVVGHNIIDYSTLIKDYHETFKDISRFIVFICLNDAHFDKGVIKNIKLQEKHNSEIFYIKILKKINIYLRNKSALFVLLKSKFTKSDERHFDFLIGYYNDQNILKKYKSTILQMHNFSKLKKIKVDYVLLPYSYQIKKNCNNEVLQPQIKINKIFSDLKINLYDLTNEFCQKKEKKLFLTYDPVHLSESGHRFVSNFLIKKLNNN
tara:strand:- start:1258 stop:2223 length:966 start_codon:yes stop_codon:yes gene_type:complete